MGGKRRGLAKDQVTGLVFLGALAAFAAAAVVLRGAKTDSGEGYPRPAVEFTLPKVGGGEAGLAELRGKVVLVDFWATWCLECREEQPTLSALHEAFAKDGFSVLAVSLDARKGDVVEPYIRQNPAPYPVVMAGAEPVEGWPVDKLPTAFLVDRGGRIVKRYVGFKFYDKLSEDIRSLL